MHTEGGLEVARVVKNMPSLKVLDLNGEYWRESFRKLIDSLIH